MAETFKRIDDADYAVLSKYHRELDHLINGHFLVGVGSTALDWMQEWWKRYRGAAAPKVNKNCANCIADFLRGVGTAYFMEKGLRDAKPKVQETGITHNPDIGDYKPKAKHSPAPSGEARKKARKVSVKAE